MRALRVLPENRKNSDAVHIVAVLTGFAWLARGLLALTNPTYYAPVIAADYAAVALTTVAFALLAPSLWFLAASSGRNSRIAGAVGAVASLIAAVGNFVEDALHVPAFGTLYVVGALGVALALIGAAVLLMRAGSRWRAAVAILSLIGFFASSVGGEMLVGLAWLAAGFTRLLSPGVRRSRGRSGSATIYRSEQDRAAMQAWYEDAIRRLSVPVETRWCTTRFGQTHVLVAGSESAPPLVALHGWGGSALGMARQLEGLSEVFRVYAPDTIGQTGRSADVRPSIRGSAYAEWLIDVLDGLEIPRARFVGVSGGGWLALRLATLDGERIDRAALISSSGFVRPTWGLGAIPATLWPILFPSRRSVGAFLRFTSAPGWSPPKDVLEMFERFFRHVAVRRLEPQPPFSDRELRAVRVPVLLLVGEHERIFSPQRTIARARALIADVEAEIVSGVGHLMSEERPDLVNRHIREFMLAGGEA